MSEGDVADSQVIKVPAVCCFKARHGNVRVRVELLCNTAGDAVELHAVQPGRSHFLRQKAEEIAHAHGWLQNIARGKAHAADCFVDRPDNGGACVVRVQDGGAGSRIFLRRKRSVQLLKLIRPVWLCLVKGIRKPTPSNITG